jgi:hypothetical protein
MAAELNRYNFIRWHNACDDIDPLSIPRFYVKDNGYSAPILKVGEATYFYLNFNTAVDYDLDVFLMKDNVKVGSALCSLTQLVIDTNVFEYYGNFTTPDVPDGFYKLGLYSGSDLLALSNVVEVIDNPVNSVYVKFRHVKDTYLFNYSLLPTDWYQQFRLRITEADKQVQDTHDQYRSVTSNKLRNYDAKVDRYVKFETYYFDAGMHEAMEVMISHDVIYIQSKKFTFKEAYKRTVDPSSKVSKGEFELWEDQFSQDQKFDNTDIKTLSVIYMNTYLTDYFTRNNCPEGYNGSTVAFNKYAQIAGKFCSMISQNDAQSKAQDAMDALIALDAGYNTEGQAYANANGTCTLPTTTYWNVQQSQVFTRNNCSEGYIGTDYEYIVAAHTYSSIISQIDADQQALDDISANGQTEANSHGTCKLSFRDDFNEVGSWVLAIAGTASSNTLSIESGKLRVVVNSLTGTAFLYLPGCIANGATGKNYRVQIKIDELNVTGSWVNHPIYLIGDPLGAHTEQIFSSVLSVGTFDETLVMTFNMTAIGLKLIAWDDNLNINMLIDWIQIDEV